MHTLAIHGGAGTILRAAITPEQEAAYTTALRAALDAGYTILEQGGTALDAVCAAVCSLEDCPLFNAGRGAVFNHIGGHELDASVMEGSNLQGGTVAGVEGIRNPVLLARAVMEHTPHVMLAGEGARQFADSQGFANDPPEYFYTDQRYRQWQEAVAAGRIQLDHAAEDDGSEPLADSPAPPKKFGTVGAVALDQHGHLAAATSTGGLTNKQWGRVGDTPILGAGTYANDTTCAVSCTGEGEYFIRAGVARDVHCRMAYQNASLEIACRQVVNGTLEQMGGEGGLIAVDKSGNFCLPFNSEGMYRAARSSDGREVVAIYGE